MSEATPAIPPPEYEDVLPPTPTKPPDRPDRRASVVFTLVPFAVYLLARCIPLPTYHLEYVEGMRDWSDSDNIVAVGIMPWIMAAVMIDIVGRFIPGWQQLHQRANGHADLRRVMNIFGLLIAVVHAAWITFDLTYEPGFAIFDPSLDYLRPRVSSPMLAFVALMLGAIALKWMIDFAVPRSLLDKRGRVLAGALLLATIYTITREQSLFHRMDINETDLIRIAVNLLKCGMLISFILLGPPFVWRTFAAPLAHPTER